MNLLAVPALALAPNASLAGFLLFLERIGKGLRTPVRDALLAQAGKAVGHGRAFGVHEFLDQAGAFLGPLWVALGVAYGGYRLGFALLLPMALLALFLLRRARGLEPSSPETPKEKRELLKAFLPYLGFVALFALGFAHFQLLALHLERAGAAPTLIPLLFALAMGVDAIFALLGGLAFDRLGLKALLPVPFLALLATPLVLLGSGPWAWGVGVALWGGALGLQESIVRAGVGRLGGGAWAYGLFDGGFGLAWMIGSLLMGALYGLSPAHAALLSLLAEALAFLPLAFLLRKA
ncbi:MFS transporter [Thermus thermophilus]|nr:MFS transporter [Thermus thermophilus]